MSQIFPEIETVPEQVILDHFDNLIWDVIYADRRTQAADRANYPDETAGRIEAWQKLQETIRDHCFGRAQTPAEPVMCIGWPTIKRLAAGEAVWFESLGCGAVAADDLHGVDIDALLSHSSTDRPAPMTAKDRWCAANGISHDDPTVSDSSPVENSQ